MKNQIAIISLLLLFACTSETDTSDSNSETIHADQPEIAVDEVVDFSQTEPAEEEALPPNLVALLEAPIDLVAYKKEYGPSNSGGSDNAELFDTPETEGFMYRYVLFYNLREVLKSRPGESDLFHKFRILVYKLGTEVGRFNDENEELMAIECAIDNETLGDLNVYGMTELELSEKFGKSQFQTANNLIYVYKNKVLSIHLSNSSGDNKRADWFKYARLNASIDLDKNIPDYLLSFD